MFINKLEITLKSTNANGWPKIKAFLNDDFICTEEIKDCYNLNFTIPVAQNKEYTLIIERFGKDNSNTIIEQGEIIADQIIILDNIKVDGVKIPDFYILENSSFNFNNQTHQGSKYWAPNGYWIFKFKSPIITHILDSKIIHEAKYSNDYLYPWSYQFGPDSVNQQTKKLNEVILHVNEVLKNEK